MVEKSLSEEGWGMKEDGRSDNGFAFASGNNGIYKY